MPLSLNEIRKRAHAFSLEWADASNEDADAKEFLIQFLDIFGITRRRVATFEHRLKKLDDGDGYIDLLWKGMLLVEMKSRGKDLSKAYQQAKDYCHGLKEHELPKLILISDFQRFHVYDENGQQTSFALAELASYLHLFDCLRGLERRTITEEDPVNLQAAELMGQLHDKLKAIGYEGHALELYLVRLLFLLFADDTGIFDRGSLYDYLRNNTRDDGSDLAMHLASIFDVVNRPPEKRLKNLDEELARFPYINGRLFEEQLPPASFDSDMRRMLLQASQLDWGKISPAIFGSLFQSVMDPKARRNLGAHYTSEKNILKLIGPLFLDELKAEYQQKRNNKNELRRLHARMADLRFLDPACGCGNFLLITYREMRLLEMDIVNDLLQGQTVTDIGSYFLLDVDKYYGIEYEEFPAQIAQVAMWLMDHQMNLLASQRFGDYYVRLPLRKSATIRHGNALRIDWQSLLAPASTVTVKAETANVFMVEEPPGEYQTLNVYARNINLNPAAPAPDTDLRFDYIMGNPPFIGGKLMSDAQRRDMARVLGGVRNYGLLDYVCCWFYIAKQYTEKYGCEYAFVATNSITQGEQVGILWPAILTSSLQIRFAHRSFVWNNEAKGQANVHCVIIGLTPNLSKSKTIFSSRGVMPTIESAKHINPYLIDFKNVFITNRQTPISCTLEIVTGNKPIDNGHYIFSENEMAAFAAREPNSLKYFQKFKGSLEFINNTHRWILFLKNIEPNELRQMPQVVSLIQKVKEYRLSSESEPTKKLASTPTNFHTEFIPTGQYLILPEVSSERRLYMPIGFCGPDILPSNKLRVIPQASFYDFGVLTSLMHNVWIKTVTGRMKSDISYSVKLTFNNFPWPLNPSDKQKQAVEAAAQAVLDARAQFPNSSLADLYDPNTMPPILVKAHQALDKAVDLCYRPQPFASETKRIEYLFELYDQYTAGLFAKEKKKKK